MVNGFSSNKMLKVVLVEGYQTSILVYYTESTGTFTTIIKICPAIAAKTQLTHTKQKKNGKPKSRESPSRNDKAKSHSFLT